MSNDVYVIVFNCRPLGQNRALSRKQQQVKQFPRALSEIYCYVYPVTTIENRRELSVCRGNDGSVLRAGQDLTDVRKLSQHSNVCFWSSGRPSSIFILLWRPICFSVYVSLRMCDEHLQWITSKTLSTGQKWTIRWKVLTLLWFGDLTIMCPNTLLTAARCFQHWRTHDKFRHTY